MKTLQQVIDWHLEKAENIRSGLSTGYAPEHLGMADALRAHLSHPVAQGEAVAWRRSDGEGGWFYSEEPSQFDIKHAGVYGIAYQPLYAKGGGSQAAQCEWEDSTGFSVSMIRDEANNWTPRETGKQMLLNYADALEAGTLAASPDAVGV